MRAVILAAGEGTRLRPFTADRPKCLVELAGRPLLAWQMDALAAAGVDDVTIVTGYRAEAITVGTRRVVNERYDDTNMVASLMCARAAFDGTDDVLVAYSDIVYEPRLVEALAGSPAAVSVLVDREWRALWELRMADPLGDAETLRMDPDGRLRELGRKPSSYDDIGGQYVGLVRVRADVAPDWPRRYDALDPDGTYEGRDRDHMFMTAFLQLMIDDDVPVYGVTVDRGWLEVDTCEDLEVYADLHDREELAGFVRLGTEGGAVKLFSKSAKVPNGRKAFEQLPLAERVITFYAEDAGSWPHFAPIIEVLTGDLGRSVCYLTSAPDDPILEAGRPNVRPFYIGEGVKRAFLFQTMEVGVLVATVPQLGISVLPRSRFAEKLGTRYLYVFHSMASTHMIYEPDGFDHYDTVLCVGPYMVDEIRAREAQAGLPAKELIEHGYGRLDTILADRSSAPRPETDRPTVLVAPSWGPTCIFETIGADVVRTLLDGGCRVIARPHPMTRKRSPGAVEEIAATFASHPEFTLDEDIAATRSLHESDVMVSDWSGAALEYAFGRERPVVFLDVERKVNNADYETLGIEPFEASVRDQIGVVVDPGDLSTLVPAVHQMTESTEEWGERLRAVREANIFNVGHSGRVAAEQIAAAASAFSQARGR